MPNPYMSETPQPPRWWENPARPCKDKPEYSEPESLPGTPSERRMAMRELALSCMVCPVLAECRAEMLTFPAGTAHGIRAGKISL